MPSRESIEGYRAGNSAITALVAAELDRYFRTLDLTDPEAVRDALLAYTPLLVEAYGAVAQELALEWYESMRFEAGDAAAAFRAIAPPLPDLMPAVQGNIRYAAGHLFKGDPEQALSDIQAAVHKHVLEPGRQAMIYNANQEGVEWARVPSGLETCSFCLVLASRGAVYLSDRSAGDGEKYGEENLFHGLCDCEIVPFGQFEEYPPEYIHSDYLKLYENSVGIVGTRNNLELILYDMRRRNSALKDYVDDPEYLKDPESQLPAIARKLAEDRAKREAKKRGD